MKLKPYPFLLFLSLLTVLLTVSAVAGQPTPPSAPPGAPNFRDFRERLKEVGLTDDQRAKLRDLNRRTGTETRELLHKLGDATRRLDEVLGKYDLDERRARSIMREIASIQAKLMEQRLRTQIELRKIMRPDQFAKFDEITRQRAPWFGGWREGWRGPGGPGRPTPPGPPPSDNRGQH
jgi:Spy/CpxP family protein refolding chaperone